MEFILAELNNEETQSSALVVAAPKAEDSRQKMIAYPTPLTPDYEMRFIIAIDDNIVNEVIERDAENGDTQSWDRMMEAACSLAQHNTETQLKAKQWSIHEQDNKNDYNE
jgi:hypothetical protein